MENVLNLAKESGKTLLEIFAQIPGSFEAYRSMIREALRQNPPTEVQDADHIWIEGCIGKAPEKVVFEAVTYNDDADKVTRDYYQANLALGENNQVLFTDVQKVEIEAVVTAKNEMQQLLESNQSENIVKTEFNETVDATVTLQPLTEAEAQQGLKRKGSVQIAQKADTKNKNNRVYPKAVLQEAVVEAQKQINEFNGLLMDSQHRTDANGNNLTDLRETVAVIKRIEFNEETGAVELPEIEFVETQAGKDIMALLESGAKLQVSQRAHGTSHDVWDAESNESYQKINWLRIIGFDFVPGGAASVAEAHFESKNESVNGDATSKPTSEEAGASQQNENSQQSAENGNGGGNASPETVRLNEEDRGMLQGLKTQLTRKTDELEESRASLDEATKKTRIAHLKAKGTSLLEAEVSGLSRFNEEQKQMILNEIDVVRFYDSIPDVFSEEAILQVIRPAVHKSAEKIDKVIASTTLENWGFPVDQRSGIANGREGQVRVSVLHENMPGAEMQKKVIKEALKIIRESSDGEMYYMPDNHPSLVHLDEVMSWFWQENYHAVKNENTIAQSDIGGRIASISAMVIPTVWRMMTAFQVVDTEPMPNRLLDKKIRIQAQGHNTSQDAASLYANLDPGENGNIEEVSSKYLNFPLYATRQALRTKLTPEAKATARNTPMQPMIDGVVDLVMNIHSRTDAMLWLLMVIRGLHQETGQVTTFETLTRVGTTKTWKSANPAWIPLTWNKTHDDNGNPLTARFEELSPATGKSAAPTGFGTQGIELQTSNATPVALLYGTDYTVDYQSGRITLTAAGETKRGSDNIQAKYTYSKNVSTWSMTPPSGTSLSAHLLMLRRAVGQRRVAITNRNWIPNAVGFDYDIEDLITHGDRMTTLGGTPAEVLNQMNKVTKYGGLEPIKSSAMPERWIPVLQKGAACHGVHTPWSFKPPITNENTGIEYVLGEQFSASDVPVNDRIGIVAVLP